MTDDLGRMPLAPEMHAFQRKISGNERLVPGRKSQNGAIIADSDRNPRVAATAGAPLDVPDQVFLQFGQGEINI